MSGAEELRDLFMRILMTSEAFGFRGFTRLKQLQHLLQAGQNVSYYAFSSPLNEKMCPSGRVAVCTAPLQTLLPYVHTPQATSLALENWRRGLARVGALTAIRAFLAPLRGHKEQPVRQSLRALRDAAAAQRGTARCTL
jgi:hypothetical protein